jgi:hypothetical protein
MMANGKSQPPVMPVAYSDFYKSNGSNNVFYTEGPSLTRQEFADECDINSLMKRYEGHVVGGPGNLPPMDPSAMYVDFADMPTDLMNYMERMSEAEKAFMTLPAVVRKQFDNSAVAFVEYASDPGNLSQMRDWGLAPPAAAPPVSQEPASPSPAPGASHTPST